MFSLLCEYRYRDNKLFYIDSKTVVFIYLDKGYSAGISDSMVQKLAALGLVWMRLVHIYSIEKSLKIQNNAFDKIHSKA